MSRVRFDTADNKAWMELHVTHSVATAVMTILFPVHRFGYAVNT
jgi:hypothetical protein